MKLSSRLSMIAGEVIPGHVAADIGTDHGYIPIWLLENGVCPRVILSDVSPGSLRKARDDSAALSDLTRADFRLGDGLTVLSKGEADDILMAGMGGKLMASILLRDPDLTRSFRRFVLQPRKNPGILRAALADLGLKEVREQLVLEGRFHCLVITAETGQAPEPEAEPVSLRIRKDPALYAEMEYPDMLADCGSPLLAGYLKMKRKIESDILEGIGDAETDAAAARRSAVQMRIRRIDAILEGIGAGQAGRKEE